jgi:hypothetical protein
MFGTLERLALGAEASEPRQPSIASSKCPEASRREIPSDDGYGAHGKSPAFTATRPRKRVGSGSSKER